MTTTDSTLVVFDPSLAQTFDALQVVKLARVVDKPAGETTVIDAEWGEEQTFVGSYVEILDEDGSVKYGSALNEWLDMHTSLDTVENGWVKESTVDAYQSDVAGTLETVLSDGTKETTKPVAVGDWIVRQQGGEVQCIDADQFGTIYDVTSARPLEA